MIDEKKLTEDIINTPSKVMSKIPYEQTMFTNIQNRQNEILDIIKEQPKVGEWIPVSERLPEGENEVLITVNGKFDNITFDNAVEKGFYCEDDGWIIDGYLDWITPEVTAWQPLPEPWKGEVNE